jgi:hypothetical protein
MAQKLMSGALELSCIFYFVVFHHSGQVCFQLSTVLFFHVCMYVHVWFECLCVKIRMSVKQNYPIKLFKIFYY